jgi:hypothetical protein
MMEPMVYYVNMFYAIIDTWGEHTEPMVPKKSIGKMIENQSKDLNIKMGM